jgi:hypothetical protein
MTPPPGHPAEAHQAGGLRGDAVRGHQLLLLAQRVEEAERVAPEPDDRHHREQREREQRARRHLRALAPSRGGEHDERDHQPGGRLHAHAHGQQRGALARAREGARLRTCHMRTCRTRARRSRARHEGERAREHEQHERVVVRAARGELEQHGVEPHERGGGVGRAPHPRRRARCEGDPAEGGRHRDRLQRPQPAAHAEPRERVGDEREQRPVGGVLERPADEREDRVGGGFGRDVRVGGEPVQHPQPRERQIAERVLGDERRAQQEQRVGRHDRERDRPAGERS